jgi:CBS domain-containing protein
MMSVAVILAEKGANVVTITPSTTIADAASVLAAKHIGCVVVVDESGGIAGILSERDIVRALAARGASILEEQTSALMTRKVETGTPAETIHDVMERMTRGKFRHVPICEGRSLVGIISIGDVVKHRLADVEREASAMRDYIATA